MKKSPNNGIYVEKKLTKYYTHLIFLQAGPQGNFSNMKDESFFTTLCEFQFSKKCLFTLFLMASFPLFAKESPTCQDWINSLSQHKSSVKLNFNSLKSSYLTQDELIQAFEQDIEVRRHNLNILSAGIGLIDQQKSDGDLPALYNGMSLAEIFSSTLKQLTENTRENPTELMHLLSLALNLDSSDLMKQPISALEITVRKNHCLSLYTDLIIKKFQINILKNLPSHSIEIGMRINELERISAKNGKTFHSTPIHLLLL